MAAFVYVVGAFTVSFGFAWAVFRVVDVIEGRR